MVEWVQTEFNDGIFTITLDHPKVNALTLEMGKNLQAAFKAVAQQRGARVVLLRGAGDTFSGGQDINEIIGSEETSYRKHMLETYNPLVLQIRQLGLPVVAEICGTVAGAALGLALACDLRIASESARFVVGFLGIGLAPDSAISLLLPALIGLGRASEFAFTNASVDAREALALGLVNRVVPAAELENQTADLAATLARGPIHAMGLTKRAFNKAVLPHLEEVLDYEAHIQDIAGRGEEHKEGVRAFLEKRPASYYPL